MGNTSSFGGKGAAAIVALLCACGGSYWYFTSQDSAALSDATAQLSAQASSDVSLSNKNSRGETTLQQVSAPLSLEPGKPAPDPVEEVKQRVEKAIAETQKVSSAVSSSLEGTGGSKKSGARTPLSGTTDVPASSLSSKAGTSVSGTIDTLTGKTEQEKKEEASLREDSVVTGGFVQDLAGWLASCYRPAKSGAGSTTATLVRANSRYSSAASLRSVERDQLKSRTSILRYVYSPGTLEALYLLYADRFLEAMEAAALRNGNLAQAQLADFFRVYGDRFQRLATSLKAASEVDLAGLTKAVWFAGKKEQEANEAFSRAYTAYAEAKDNGQREEAVRHNRTMIEQSRLAGLFAAEQERASRHMASVLRRQQKGKAGLSEAELVFMGEWIVRHHGSQEATRAASEICARMAARCEERAASLSK